MIKSEIEQLIELYQSEKSNLETLIKECLPEWDFLLAHHHSKALQKINKELQTLYNFVDPFHDTREHLLSFKTMYEKKFAESDDDYMKKHYAQQIAAYNQRLDELDKKDRKQNIDGQEFDDAIYELIEGKISGFKFHLKKESNFYLSFMLRSEDSLVISFTPNNSLLDEFILTGSNLRALTGLGFALNSLTGSLEYTYDLTLFKNSIFIKTLVSRIIFGVFYYREFDDPAFIEYDSI